MRSLRLLLFLAAPLVFSACSLTETTPDEIRRALITRIVIDDFPVAQPGNGEGWDGSSTGEPQADVYIRLLGRSNDDVLFNSENGNTVTIPDEDGDPSNNPRNYPNADENDLLIFNVNLFEIDVLERTLRVEVRDDDGLVGGDELVGITDEFQLEDFIPATLPSDHTTTIDLQGENGALRVRMTLRWEE